MDAPRSASNEFWDLVAPLSVSSLYYVGDPRGGMPIWTTPLSAMPETLLEAPDREALLRALRDALG